jgi:hypothetical protein
MNARTTQAPGWTASLRLALFGALACTALPAPAQTSPWGRLTQLIAPGAPAPQAPAAPAQTAAAPADPAPRQVASLGATTPDGTPLQEAATELSLSGASFGKQMDLGKESEDTGAFKATNLFANPDIRRLLGDNPRFTYKAGSLQDPMMVPWVRNAAIFKELSAQADAAMTASQLDKAADLYKKILDMKDPRYQAMALAKLGDIAGLQNERAKAALAATGAEAEPPVELPTWVSEHTTGVLVGEDKNICLVGDSMLSVGDALPNYPDVKVAEIDKDKVVYAIRNKTFAVELTSH